MRLRALLLILSVALLAFAPAPFAKRERHRVDPNDLSGTWELFSSELRGQQRPDTNDYLCEITKDQLAFVLKSERRRTAVYSVRLFPQLTPAAFALGQNNNVSFVGSYRLQGNELTLIFISGSTIDQRPTDFGGKPMWCYKLRRLHR